MAKSKSSSRSSRLSGVIRGLRSLGSGVLSAGAGGAPVVFRAFTGVLILALLVAWLVGRQPLQRAAAAGVATDPSVRFEWPQRAGAPNETWVPPPVQRDMARAALESIGRDPFDRGSLEAARGRLLETGWFASVDRVARRPGNVILIEAQWRVPVAVVQWDNSEYLVGHGGEILRLPEFAPVAPGSMAVIRNPHSPPPRDERTGGVVYGKPWSGGDIQAAVRLLDVLRGDPSLSRLRTIELSDYMRSGHLSVVSDLGCRFVWGSAIGEPAPGEVPVEKRLARLRDLVAQRADGVYSRIDIFLPQVLVDKTVTSARP
ncbi:MAG TPA: hypothetical protein DEB06_03925 [Phycisphaerales bacterium]|nr:hypothetical protein [Phycisphaerales bacterium]